MRANDHRTGSTKETKDRSLLHVRRMLAVFLSLLVLSGLTAFSLRTELNFLTRHADRFPDVINKWIHSAANAIAQTSDIMLYGTDWLAFAHIVIALFFIPVYINPVRYKANIQAGMAACLLVFPLAFICGSLRGIPFFHQLIDCSFGVFGFLCQCFILSKINTLKTEQ